MTPQTTSQSAETAIVMRNSDGTYSVTIGSPEYGIWTPANMQRRKSLAKILAQLQQYDATMSVQLIEDTDDATDAPWNQPDVDDGWNPSSEDL